MFSKALNQSVNFFNSNVTSSECEEQYSSLKRDFLTDRINILQYPGNDPIEDRFNAHQFTKSTGYYSAVFDGIKLM